MAAGFLKGVQHVHDAVALAGAQVADEEAAAGLQLPDGADVAAGQVHHVDVVADAGAVGGGVVVAKDVDLFQLADRHLGDVGHQVVGDAVGVLADQARLVGADGVEVAQHRHIHAGVGLADVGQDPLGEHLGGAVRVGGVADREVLGDGDAGRVAVDGGRRAEHKVVAVVPAHDVQDGQGAVEVVGVVLDGLVDALAHRLVGCKLNDGGDVGALAEDVLDVIGLGHVRLIEAEVLAGDLLDAVQHHRAGVVEVVRHDDVVPRVQQLDAGVAADVPGAARYQNCHNKPSSRSICKVCPAGERPRRFLVTGYRIRGRDSMPGAALCMYFCCAFSVCCVVLRCFYALQNETFCPFRSRRTACR